jgi:hypothetical protein
VQDPMAQLRGVLDKRAKRPADAVADDAINNLLRRGFMATAERSALLEKSRARWKLGHGVPAPLELLTGSGNADLLSAALPVLEELLLKHDRWLFVPDALGNRALLTVANALRAGELAILQKGKPMLQTILDTANVPAASRKKVENFAERLGEASVVGGYRATPHAPARLFVAPAAKAVEAGIIAAADGGLNPHTGQPLLLELASLGARTGLALEAFNGVVEAAYAKAHAGNLFNATRATQEPTP